MYLRITDFFFPLWDIGSGFGQKEGTWHFRSTFLPEEHLFDQFCKNLEEFHKNFLEKHRKSIV